MEGVLVDTNVLLDVLTDVGAWADWSETQLEAWSARGPLLVNDIVYAELSVGYLRIEEVDAALSQMGAALAPIPRPALFLAGKAFQNYRLAG